jgi:hypothetical protein
MEYDIHRMAALPRVRLLLWTDFGNAIRRNARFHAPKQVTLACRAPDNADFNCSTMCLSLAFVRPADTQAEML